MSATETECSHEGCAAKVKSHRWGQTRAHSEGWFFGKDGLAYCPEHTPQWVAEWRARKGRS